MNEKPMTGKDVIKRTIPVAIALLLIAVIIIGIVILYTVLVILQKSQILTLIDGTNALLEYISS